MGGDIAMLARFGEGWLFFVWPLAAFGSTQRRRGSQGRREVLAAKPLSNVSSEEISPFDY
jgi:hypothetical protein